MSSAAITPVSTGSTVTPSTTTATGSSSASAALSSPPVTEQDFLQLLTAELANQDPLSPVQGTQFVAQLAQFTELSAVTTLQQQNAVVDGAALIGKTVSNTQGSGVVQSATVTNGQVQLTVKGLGSVPLSSVTAVNS